MEYDYYVKGISNIIKNYRKGELSIKLDEQHVIKWLSQFSVDEQPLIAAEMYNVLSKYYYTQKHMCVFLKKVIEDLKIKSDLNNISILNVQSEGYSQILINNLFKNILLSDYSVNIDDNKESNQYVYIDDGVYTSSRLRKDLIPFILKCDSKSTIFIYHFLAFKNGYDYGQKMIREVADKRNIKVHFCCDKILENRRNDLYQGKLSKYTFMWPSIELSNIKGIKDFELYLKQTGKAYYLYKNPNNINELFSSKSTDKLVNQIFIKYGLEIIKNTSKSFFYPLGYSNSPSFGFGSICVFFYNISNTCPLALWWGSIENENTTLNNWYPLLPRRSHSEIYKVQDSFNLNNYLSILRTVSSLSKKRYYNDNLNEIKIYTGKDLANQFEFSDMSKSSSELYEFLNGLTLDEVKVIETVMYIGRDYENVENIPVSNPKYVFSVWKDDLESNFSLYGSVDEKDILVSQIHEKALLHEYIKNGCKILGLEL